MSLQDSALVPGWLLLVDSQASQSLLFPGWHAIVVIACLWIAFRVRGQNGGTLIMLGVGMILGCQLALLTGQLAQHEVSILPSITTLLFFGANVLGYALTGAGLMKPHQHAMGSVARAGTWLGIAFFIVVCIDVSLLADRLAGSAGTGVSSAAQESSHVLSLLLLIVLVSVRHTQHRKLSRKAAAGERQVDAMLSMFAAVKHELNNDMQVVVGNAELASILLASNGDIEQPINKITDAATMAVERIEQLSVFSAASITAPSAIDLNAVLRESVSNLTSELPSIVILRLELEHIPIRVMADRYLLGLSVSYLIKQAVKTMDHGGEIVIRTRYMAPTNAEPPTSMVNAEVFIVRALSGSVMSNRRTDNNSLVANNRLLKLGLATTEALVERSGAISVGHSMAPNESLIDMAFATETQNRSAVSAPSMQAGLA